MSGSTGTGRPVKFFCTKCRRNPSFHTMGRHNPSFYKVEATGRVRPLPSAQAGRGGSRVLQFMIQYHCPVCKYTGWSRHSDLAPLLLKRAGRGYEVSASKMTYEQAQQLAQECQAGSNKSSSKGSSP